MSGFRSIALRFGLPAVVAATALGYWAWSRRGANERAGFPTLPARPAPPAGPLTSFTSVAPFPWIGLPGGAPLQLFARPVVQDELKLGADQKKAHC